MLKRPKKTSPYEGTTRAKLGDYDPSDDRYSKRNSKAKYVQRLLLDTARVMMPSLLRRDPKSGDVIAFLWTPDQAKLVHHSATGAINITALPEEEKDRLLVLGDALARQIQRLTGCEGFEIKTWENSLVTQPVAFRLLTETGGEMELFNPRFTANHQVNGIKNLSQALTSAFGEFARLPGDLDRLIADGGAPGWRGTSTETAEMYYAALGINSKRASSTHHDEVRPAIDAARTRLGSDLPEVIIQVEAYEESLRRSIVHRFSRWGQNENLAQIRTERRLKALSSALVEDINPLSRSLKETSISDLIALANDRPLSHLAIEFGVSDTSLRKRLKKIDWVSPRARAAPHRSD